MTGRCGTCKHWTVDDDWFASDLSLTRPPDEPSDAYYSRLEVANAAVRTCKAIELLSQYEAVDEIPLAFTKDGSDYRADLRTRAEFGCVLHEETGA